MKRITRTLAALGVLLLAASLAWGAGQEEGSGAGGIPDQVTLPLAEKITVDYTIAEHTTIGHYAFADDGHPGFMWLEEQTNIEINDIQIPPGEIDAKYQVMLATGDLPDIFNPGASTLTKADLDAFGDKGLFVNILDYAHLIPGYVKLMEEVEPLRNMTTKDGKKYGFASYNADPIPFSLTLAYREDLWEKMDLPRDTWEDLYEAFKTLKAEFPDSYPVNAWQTGDRSVLLFMAGANFNTDESIYFNHTNREWQYGPLDAEYEYFMEYFSRLWAEGLLHPDTFTMSYDQWSQSLANHESFFTWWWSASGNWFSPVTQFKLPDYGPGKEWTFSALRIPSLVEGGPRARSRNTMPYGNYRYVKLISAQSEHIPEIMAFMDFLTVEKNSYSVFFGPPGEYWDIVDGKYRWLTPEIKTPYNPEGTMADHEWFLQKFGVRTSLANVAIVGIDNPRMQANMTIESDPDYTQFEVEARQYVADGSTPQRPEPITNFTAEQADREAQLKTALDTYAQEQSILFITGKRPLSEFAAFQDEIRNLGAEELIELYKTASS
jgi:putative aldouronate transport system substrate-binding protein